MGSVGFVGVELGFNLVGGKKDLGWVGGGGGQDIRDGKIW